MGLPGAREERDSIIVSMRDVDGVGYVDRNSKGDSSTNLCNGCLEGVGDDCQSCCSVVEYLVARYGTIPFFSILEFFGSLS